MQRPRYIFPLSERRGTRLQINGYAIREVMPSRMVLRPAGTGDFLLMQFHGRARSGVEDDAPWGKRETLIIWKPGQGQYYGSDRPGWSHSWLHCEGSQAESLLLSRESLLVGRHLAPGDRAMFLTFLAALHQEMSGAHPADEVIVENLFENWVRQLHRELTADPPVVPERLQEVRRYIDAHYAGQVTLDVLARRAHWSPAHFSEEFHRAFGLPPIAYLIRSRMHHATYLLSDLNLGIKEVALRVGYADLQHFTKLFKRHCGVTPGSLRPPRTSR